MICEECGMLTKPYNDGTCEFGDHKVIKDDTQQPNPSKEVE